MSWMTLDQVSLFEIELSNYCNAKCPACAREMNTSTIDSSNLSLDQIKRLVEQLPDPTKVKFYFGGTSGDPLMNPNIVEIFKYVAASGVRLTVDTNGSLRSTAVWKELGNISKNTNVDITFSIDGLEDTNHLYRIDTNWKTIMRNLSTYISAGGRADWKYLIFEHNKHQVEDARELARSLGVVGFVSEPSSRVSTTLVPVNKTRKHNVTEIPTSIYCRSLNTNYLYISSSFVLFPCCYFHARQDQPADVQCDLTVMSLNDAVEHIKYKELSDAWQTSNCSAVCKIYCNQNKYWDKIIKLEKL